ncbi:hypothetical protein [Selenomonas sp. KH1T6]|uniref:hypothetical protein n=1 Tax=Selenomonas sp. KH1T6 TaxID=3158784 RepID=UPI0008A79415|nr:hypothetical protein SAMN05216583_12141 [Selenomonas ruminantium]
MPQVNGKEISRELLAAAMRCDSPEELMRLAKEQGVEIAAEEAKAFLAEMEEIELDSEMLKNVAGGRSAWGDALSKCRL